MNDTLELLYELCDMTTNKLWMLKEKFAKNNREIPNNDVDLFDKLTHSLKSIKTTIAMMESEEEGGYSGNYHGSYGQGNSYRGSYRNMKRNSMGRYSRTNGLHDMIDNLPEDKMIQVQRYIEEMGRM